MHRQRVEIKPELVKYIERLLEKQGKIFFDKLCNRDWVLWEECSKLSFGVYALLFTWDYWGS